MAVDGQKREHTERADGLLAQANDAAIGELLLAVEADPRDLALRARLAELFARAGRTQEAIAQLQPIAGYHAARGSLFKALAIARAILALDPAHQETMHALASLYAIEQGIDEGGARFPERMAAAFGPLGAPLPDVPLAPRLGLFFLPRASINQRAEPPVEPSELVRFEGALLRAPLFSMLEHGDFLALMERLQLRWVEKGERLVEAGEAGDAMFIVVQGAIEISAPDGDGVATVAWLGEGSFFGEKALMGESLRSATAIAAEDGLVFVLRRSALKDLDAEHPELRRAVDDFFRQRLLANLLEVSPLFRAVEAERKRELSGRFWVRALEPGTQLLEQGRPGAGFFVLLRGACDVFHVASDGVQHSYPSMKPGDVFGEISLLFDSPCTATVQSRGWCEVLELPRQEFNDLLLSNAEVKSYLVQLAQERLNRTAAHRVDSNGEVQSSWMV